jgi:hypothetical protein
MSWMNVLKAKTLKQIYDEVMTRNFVLPLNELKIDRSNRKADGSIDPDYAYSQPSIGRHDFVYALEDNEAFLNSAGGYEGSEYEETIHAHYTKFPEEIEKAAIKQYNETPEGLGVRRETIDDYEIETRKAINHDMDDVFVEFFIHIRKGKRLGQDAGDLKASQFADKMKF